ncbi:MAG: fasciclin domain-containing protein [Bacteroidales bacterium]
MKLKFVIYIAILVVVFEGCNDTWDEHYSPYSETVDQNVWEAMVNTPEISDFIQILKDFEYDTLFLSNTPYTLFIPTNEAITQYENTIGKSILDYHISSHFIQSGNISGVRQIQTLSRKFALFQKSGTGMKLDDIPINSESPLYTNGKFFIMDQVAEPRPNFYEYYALNNPVLKTYIDSQDSIILDRERSEPIGFDDQGRTIFDTVSIIFNLFEDAYFPVKEEFRNQAATFVFPLKEDYENALTTMALNLNIPGYTDYNSISMDWQHEILIPLLLKQGVFANRLEPEEFMWKSITDTTKLKNIVGDSIVIKYTPVGKVICSNGYAYNYDVFEIPDSLYLGVSRFEGEWLLKQTGVNRYAWLEDVIVKSDQTFQPAKSRNPNASNDSIMSVTFPNGYSGQFSLEFSVPQLFPREYLMVVKTHMDIGGIYDIYVNDQQVFWNDADQNQSFNYYEFVVFRGIIFSNYTGKRYIPEGRYNSFDMYVGNIETYGDVKIRFEYRGPEDFVPSNGLVIDYIDFIPYDN